MQFITCPDCGREISSRADFCPQCGCPKRYFELPAPVVGGSFKMGRFNGKDLTWRVLLEQNGYALITTTDVLREANGEPCRYRFNEYWYQATWKQCTLNTWLNNEFIEEAFNMEEREAITLIDVETWDNPEFRTEGGDNVFDEIFVLSIWEAQNYFEDNADRACDADWWLRTPGDMPIRSAFVAKDGYVDEKGWGVSLPNASVRPAMWVRLDSEFMLKPSEGYGVNA